MMTKQRSWKVKKRGKGINWKKRRKGKTKERVREEGELINVRRKEGYKEKR